MGEGKYPIERRTGGPMPASARAIQEMFATALRHHQSGQLAEAEKIYRRILAQDPRHADSRHLLGVMAHQLGRHSAAVDLIGQAISLKRDVPFYHNNLALALKELGRFEEATTHYERALALQPTYVEAHSNLGNLRLAQGRAQEALAHYDQALKLRPDYAEAQLNYGNALTELGRLDEAVTRYERAVALRPDYAAAYVNLGHARRQQNRLADAVTAYQRALSLAPDLADASYNLGNALFEMGRLDEAITQLERALALKPDAVETLNSLGVAYEKRGEADKAVTCYERALALNPDHVETRNNLGVALQNRGALDEAVASFERALALRPDDTEARKNLGIALHARAAERSGRLLKEQLSRDVGGVKGQYETLPFPARAPEAERHVLYVSVADIPAKVNQYCFGGARDFSAGIRVLVSGCGTGDSAIWLGQQLRDTPSEIVALDLSAASLAVARDRAEIRGLRNINWVNASLLDVAKLGLGRFDYITCLGVLHHLPDPEAGLAALASVLAEDGGMAVMLYGLQGRSHIYAMQDLLRRLTVGAADRAERLATARHILSALPVTNLFRVREGWQNIQQGYLQDDTNLWDTLLHEQDRAYTASGVRDFMASAGLKVQTFATYKGTPAISALQYDLDLYVDDPAIRARLAKLPEPEREDLAEALDGGLTLHTVYAARASRAALDPTSPDAILSPMSELGRSALRHLSAAETEIPIILRNGRTISYRPSPACRAFLAAIDGTRDNSAIARTLSANGDAADFLNLIAPELRVPTALHWLVARKASGTAWPVLAMQSKFSLPLRHEEPVLLVETPART